jgi:hypothetical protein
MSAKPLKMHPQGNPITGWGHYQARSRPPVQIVADAYDREVAAGADAVVTDLAELLLP